MINTRLTLARLAAAIAFGILPGAALAQPCGTPTGCPQDASEADTMALDLRLRWHAIGEVALDAAGLLRFPDVGAEPGIYRFQLWGQERRAIYIGETHSLKQRFYQYRAPGPRQPTNQRICIEMRQTLATGGRVQVSIGRDAWFCAKAACTSADLASTNQRRLLEQLAIFAVPMGVRVLNSEARSGPAPHREFSFCS